MSSARRLGYRLLGPAFDYLLHTRPAEWPIMTAHTALGVLLAVGLDRRHLAAVGGQVLLGLVAWVVGLNGGTLAINSAFDRDEGDVAYLTNPPVPPPHLFTVGISLMLAGGVAAMTLPIPYRWAYGICFTMSVLYSVPPARLKSVAGADWVINLLGFGALTPFAGWASTGEPVAPWAWCLLIGFGALFAALYPLTQLYQFEEDQRRGDRTFALVLGMARSLTVALVCTVVAFLAFAVAAERIGLGAEGPAWGRWAGLGVALAAWLAVLIPWRRGWAAWRPADHQRGMHLALGAWAVTDAAVLAGFLR